MDDILIVIRSIAIETIAVMIQRSFATEFLLEEGENGKIYEQNEENKN